MILINISRDIQLMYSLTMPRRLNEDFHQWKRIKKLPRSRGNISYSTLSSVQYS